MENMEATVCVSTNIISAKKLHGSQESDPGWHRIWVSSPGTLMRGLLHCKKNANEHKWKGCKRLACHICSSASRASTRTHIHICDQYSCIFSPKNVLHITSELNPISMHLLSPLFLRILPGSVLVGSSEHFASLRCLDSFTLTLILLYDFASLFFVRLQNLQYAHCVWIAGANAL